MGRTHARKEVQVHARKPPSAALLHFIGDFLHVDLKNVRRLSLYKDCPWFIAIAQGPLITDGRNRNEMIFSKISLARMTWHFKSNEDIITKF